MNVEKILTRPFTRFARHQPPQTVTLETAVDVLGDFNISPRSRCGPKFGWDGAPSKDPVVPFSEIQLTKVKRTFKHVHLLVRYASLTQVISRSHVSVAIPHTIMESEEGNERTQPQFRLVAWTPTTSGKDVAKVVRPVGLCAHNASFTTGLSALLLAPDHGLGEGDTLKLRLKGGAATVVREGNNVWRINRTQSHYVAPLMYDFRSVGR